jgi:hypothetical protein
MTRACLFAAGLLALGLASFHFALPSVFGWDKAAAELPDSLRWALLALNDLWSLMALMTSVLVLAIAVRGWWTQTAGKAVIAAMAAYWLLHALYLLWRPFPLPPQLAALGIAFVAFPLLQIALLAPALVYMKRPAASPAH